MQLREIFTDGKFNRKLFSLSAPILVQNLMLSLVAAGDAFMLGHLNQDAMAAVSLASQIQFVQNMFLFAIATGISMLGAQYWGKKDTVVLGRLFGLGIRECLMVSLPFFLGCLLLPEKLMRIFASDPILISNGAEYLRLASWSYLITGISQCYIATMKVSEHATLSAVISSSAVVLNLLFNWPLIFGCGPIKSLGVSGAAIATVIARVIELLLCLFVTSKPGFIKLKIKNIMHYHWTLIGDFWKHSAPLLGAYLLWGIGFTSYTAIMGQLGRDSAAANSIASVVRDIICCACDGLAGGCCILIGNELGAGNLERGRQYGNRMLLLSLLIGGLSSILIMASLPLFSHFLLLTPEVYSYLKQMFIILSIYMIGRCICTIEINGVFTAGGDTLFDFYTLVIFMWCLALPCAFLGAFYFKLSVMLVYGCTCLDEVGKVPWVFLHHFKYKWVKNLTRPD